MDSKDDFDSVIFNHRLQLQIKQNKGNLRLDPTTASKWCLLTFNQNKIKTIAQENIKI